MFYPTLLQFCKMQSSPSHIWTWKHHTTNFESCTWLYLLQDYAKFGAHGGPTSCSIWETTRLLVTFWCMCVRVWWLGGEARTNINLKDPEQHCLKYVPDSHILFSPFPVKTWALRSITVGEYPPIFQHYPVPVGRLGGEARTNINLKDPERSYLKYTPDPCVLFSLLPVKPWAWRSITVGEYPSIFQHYPVPEGRLQTRTLAYLYRRNNSVPVVTAWPCSPVVNRTHRPKKMMTSC